MIVCAGDTNSDPSTSSLGFRWDAGAGVQRIEALPSSHLGYAAAISGDGAVIVGTCLQVNNRAFRWTASGGSVALDRFGTGSNQQGTATAIPATAQ